MNKLFLTTLIFLLFNINNVFSQYYYSQLFTGTTAPGWVMGAISGSTLPYLTANTIDSNGNGWLRLTENIQNQGTFTYYNAPFSAPGAQITISFDFAVYNQGGIGPADGFTFFLMDGSTSNPQPGAYGGSLGYSQRNSPNNVNGLTGGWLGVGFDIYGNYSNPTEGRLGGTGFTPNSIDMRGSGNGLNGYSFIAGSGTLPQPLNFPNSPNRPSQTGTSYRHAQITISPDNTVTVQITFGAGSNPTVVVNSFSPFSQTRPDTLMFGFTGSTGSGTEVQEIRDFGVISSVPFYGAVIPELSSFKIMVLFSILFGIYYIIYYLFPKAIFPLKEIHNK